MATSLLGEAFGHGDRIAEVQRLSPPLWGLAEAARCQGDHDTALTASVATRLLARGEGPAAYQALQAANESWQALRRFWEGTWARLDLAETAARARRRGEATVLASEARAIAAASGAAVLVAAADRLTGSFDQAKPAEPWYALSEREFEVARLVAAGLTNRQIAEQLVLAPKTISAHVTHILTKLGAARRAEIGAWCATVRQDTSR